MSCLILEETWHTIKTLNQVMKWHCAFSKIPPKACGFRPHAIAIVQQWRSVAERRTVRAPPKDMVRPAPTDKWNKLPIGPFGQPQALVGLHCCVVVGLISRAGMATGQCKPPAACHWPAPLCLVTLRQPPPCMPPCLLMGTRLPMQIVFRGDLIILMGRIFLEVFQEDPGRTRLCAHPSNQRAALVMKQA